MSEYQFPPGELIINSFSSQLKVQHHFCCVTPDTFKQTNLGRKRCHIETRVEHSRRWATYASAVDVDAQRAVLHVAVQVDEGSLATGHGHAGELSCGGNTSRSPSSLALSSPGLAQVAL